MNFKLDGVADTSNDALYDSERNILDNLYRTTIIKKDPNKSYYENDDGSYTLIDNSVYWVYSLNWDNKINYFVSYEDAKNYLREQIKINIEIFFASKKQIINLSFQIEFYCFFM